MIGNEWDKILDEIFKSDYFNTIMNKVNEEYNSNIIYPEYNNIFNAFKLCDYNNIKCVIMGQDPYHGEGEAHGLSFSVQSGVKLPPSLKNIYKEIKTDLNIDEPICGDLTSWAKEGVLLLNSTLTVRKDTPNSHKDIGWQQFTDDVIRVLNNYDKPLVFILWGNYAKSKKVLITNPKHYIIESAHPSPFSARNGFFNSKPFSKTNEFLIKNNINPINWDLN